MRKLIVKSRKSIFEILILSTLPSVSYAYSDCSSTITTTSGPCGAKGTLTIESAGSITGDALGIVGSTSRHFALINPGTSNISVQGSITNNVSGNTGIGLWNSPAATLTSLSITGSGSITGASDGFGIYNDRSIITSVVNLGTITSSAGWGLNNTATAVISQLNNLGTISGSRYAIKNEGTLAEINNSGQISASATNPISVGISNNESITSIVNTGMISGQSKGIGNSSGTITNIVNSGTISASGADLSSNGAIYVSSQNGGSIGTITNTGSLVGTTADISNVAGSVGTLNNSQGVGNPNGALTYTGILPSAYNIIVNSPTNYGQLSGSGVSGVTTFGVYLGSSLTKGTYASVLTGLASGTNVNATTGMFNGTAWNLVLNASNSWDLVVQNSATNTLQSVQINASSLATMYNQQAAPYQAALTYDCPVYDENNFCVTAGGRYTYVDASPSANAQAGLVVVGYRPLKNLRFGAFADQSINSNSPPRFSQSNPSPMWGLFAKWNLNEDGTGLGVQASVVTSSSKLTVTRPQLDNTEAGLGNTQFDGQGYQLTTNFLQPLSDSFALVPYFGLRYTHIQADAYTENTSTAVTSPLSYDDMAQNNLSAIGGVGIYSHLAEKLTATASVGFQQSLHHSMANYQGTSAITGLEHFSVQMPSANHSMATATAGLFYDISKQQRLGINVLWQQQAFSDANTTTALANYSIGF